MATQNRPGVFVNEPEGTLPTSIGLPAQSTPAFLGATARGPVGVPVLLRGDLAAEFAAVFGDPLPGESLYYAIRSAADEGATEAYVCRLAHYGDPTDPDTVAGNAASLEVDGRAFNTSATFVGDTAFVPLRLADGASLVFDVNGLGNKTMTFNAAAAELTGSAGTHTDPLPASCSFEYITKLGQTPLSADVSGTTGGSIATTVAALNEVLIGCSAKVDGTDIVLISDTRGSGSRMSITSAGAGLANIGLAVSANSGSGDVVDADAVTFAEIVARFAADVFETAPGDLLSVSLNSDNRVVLAVTDDSVTPGNTTLELVSGSASLIEGLGLEDLEGETVTGTEDSVDPALEFVAGFRGLESPGTDGDRVSVEVYENPRCASAGAGNDLAENASIGALRLSATKLTGLEAGSWLRVANATDAELLVVQSVSSAVVGGVVRFFIDLESPTTLTHTAAGSTIESLEVGVTVSYRGVVRESWTFLSPNPDSENYIVSRINDSTSGSQYVLVRDLDTDVAKGTTVGSESLSGGVNPHIGLVVADLIGDASAGTGFYALDAVAVETVQVPPSYPGEGGVIPSSAAVPASMIAYCAESKDRFALISPPPGYSAAQAEAWRNTVLGSDSRFGVVYWPHVYVRDPLSSARNARKLVAPTGQAAGVWKRVLDQPGENGGYVQNPGGEGVYGDLRSVVGVERVVSPRDQEIVNPAGINAIVWRKTGAGRMVATIMGARTLSTIPKYLFIHGCRMQAYLRRVAISGYAPFVLRPNYSRTWEKMADLGRAFLRTLWNAKQFEGATEGEAFTVTTDASVNTPEVTAMNKTRAIWRFTMPNVAEQIEVDLIQDRVSGTTVA